MIYSFGGRNFYSFRDEFSVDFRISERMSERNIFLSDADGQKVNRVMAIFGPNASGKTHLLKTLGFITWFVRYSASSSKPDAPLSAAFFRFNKEDDNVSQLWVEFEMDHQFYRYEVSFSPIRVFKESLHKRIDRLNYVFEREWVPETEQYRLKAQHEFEGMPEALAQRRNASLISTAFLTEDKASRRLDTFFRSFYGNIAHFGRTGYHDPEPVNIYSTAEYFQKEPELLEWVNHRISNFDLGLKSIKIEKRVYVDEDGDEIEKYVPIGIHHHDGKDHELLLLQESRGTQALFVLLRHILPVLQNGGIAFIDEFELGLHSHMIPRILDLFYSSQHNQKGAQIIFSTHADFVIQRMEKCQMLLVEKDDDGVSDVYSLNEVRGVRADENHYSKYHAGAYGALPRI